LSKLKLTDERTFSRLLKKKHSKTEGKKGKHCGYELLGVDRIGVCAVH
jgi:hypothetical protein